MHIEYTQKLVTEIEMLKVVLFLVCRKIGKEVQGQEDKAYRLGSNSSSGRGEKTYSKLGNYCESGIYDTFLLLFYIRGMGRAVVATVVALN